MCKAWQFNLSGGGGVKLDSNVGCWMMLDGMMG